MYKKNLYYVVIVVDFIFRFFWVLSVSNATGGLIDFKWLSLGNYTNSVLCIIEMFRRIIWNLFRVEYEHIKNCGKLNAVQPMDYNSILYPIKGFQDDPSGISEDFEDTMPEQNNYVQPLLHHQEQ